MMFWNVTIEGKGDAEGKVRIIEDLYIRAAEEEPQRLTVFCSGTNSHLWRAF
jgi:hypothetical protein